jgi:hypothetical protein
MLYLRAFVLLRLRVLAPIDRFDLLCALIRSERLAFFSLRRLERLGLEDLPRDLDALSNFKDDLTELVDFFGNPICSRRAFISRRISFLVFSSPFDLYLNLSCAASNAELSGCLRHIEPTQLPPPEVVVVIIIIYTKTIVFLNC